MGSRQAGDQSRDFLRLKILDLAQRDLIEGFRFYEEMEAGLGLYFLDSLYSDIDLLATYGGIHRKVYKDFHWALSKRFPFAIYYPRDSDTIYIRSVVDCRKNPSWIRSHLGGA